MRKILLIIFLISVCCLFLLFPLANKAYSAESIEKSVPFGDSLRFYFLGLKRFLNTRPEIVAVQRLEDDSLEVSTNNIGTGVIVIWTEEGRYTVKVDVHKPVPPPSRSSILNEFKEKRKNYFIFDASMYWDYYDNTQDDTAIDRKNSLFSGDFSLFGPTYFGQLGAITNVRHDAESDETDLNRWTVILRDGKVGPLKNFTLEVGDFEQEGEENLMPSLRMQGVRFGNYRNFRRGGFFPEKVNVFYGEVKGRSLYQGIGFFSDVDESVERNVGGVKIDYFRAHNVPWTNKKSKTKHGFVYRHYDEENSDDRDTIMYSHRSQIGRSDLDFSILDFDILSSISLFMSGEKDKWLYSVDLRSIPHLEGEYRQIGKRGVKLNAEYLAKWGTGRHFTLDSITTELGVRQDYRETDDFDGYTDPGFDFGMSAKGKAVYDIDYRARMRGREYSELILGNKQREYSLYLMRNWYLWRKINTFVGYSLKEYMSDTNPDSDRDSDTLSWGANVNILDNLRLYYNESSGETKTSSGEAQSKIGSRSVGISYSKKLLYNLNLLASLSNSKTRYESFITNASENEKDSIGLIANLGYMFTRFPGNAYVRADARKIDSTSNNDFAEDYYEYRMKTGFSFRFAAFPGLLPGCNVEGHVFKDKNGNGRFDEADEPLSNMRVAAFGGTKETSTDENGYYQFKNLRGVQANISLVMADVSKGYVVTTLSNYKIEIKNKETYTCDFGISISNQIWGRVYADVNDNSKFDDFADKTFRGITVKLQNGMKTVTDKRGFYNFVSLPKGDYTISVDYSTLPINYYSKQKLKKEVTLEEGKVVNIDYPFGAERLIMGHVYLDKDGNGEFTNVDEPVADVIVKCDYDEDDTNKNGKFTLKKLPAGKHVLTIDETTIPEEMMVTGAFPEVELLETPETIRDINIPLIYR